MGQDRQAALRRGSRRPSRAASRSGRIRSSMNSARRWPPRVEISSPTITSTRIPRSAAIARAARRASMRSWSVIAMTSRSVSASTCSRISSDARVAVRRERVDVQVRATHRGGLGASVVDHAGRPTDTGSWASGAASRSGQIGKKTAHHCSGASAMIRSKATRLRSRRRHDPLAARTVGRHRDRFERVRGSDRDRRAERRRRTSGRRSRSPAAPDRAAGVAGAPKSVTGAPPPVRSRSPTRPTASPSRERCRGAPAAPRAGPRSARRSPRASARSTPGAPDRRSSPSARRPVRRAPRGTSPAARDRRSGGRRRSTGSPLRNAASTTSGVSTSSRTSMSRGRSDGARATSR